MLEAVEAVAKATDMVGLVRLEAVEGLLEMTDVVWLIGIHEALRLGHVHLLVEHSLKKGIINVHLVYLVAHQHSICE